MVILFSDHTRFPFSLHISRRVENRVSGSQWLTCKNPECFRFVFRKLATKTIWELIAKNLLVSFILWSPYT